MASLFPFAVLLAGQILYTPASNYNLERFTGNEPLDPFVLTTQWAGESQRTADDYPHHWFRDLFVSTRRNIPRIGDEDAEQIVIKLADYTCPYCRDMHRQLERLLQERQLQVLIIPVPLHPDCYPELEEVDPMHEDACELARLAIAVWMTRPAKFAEFHRLAVCNRRATHSN